MTKERIKELREVAARGFASNEDLHQCLDEIERLTQENERLRAALGHYATPEYWHRIILEGVLVGWAFTGNVQSDYKKEDPLPGELAREALKRKKP